MGSIFCYLDPSAVLGGLRMIFYSNKESLFFVIVFFEWFGWFCFRPNHHDAKKDNEQKDYNGDGYHMVFSL